MKNNYRIFSLFFGNFLQIFLSIEKNDKKLSKNIEKNHHLKLAGTNRHTFLTHIFNLLSITDVPNKSIKLHSNLYKVVNLLFRSH